MGKSEGPPHFFPPLFFPMWAPNPGYACTLDLSYVCSLWLTGVAHTQRDAVIYFSIVISIGSLLIFVHYRTPES